VAKFKCSKEDVSKAITSKCNNEAKCLRLRRSNTSKHSDTPGVSYDESATEISSGVVESGQKELICAQNERFSL